MQYPDKKRRDRHWVERIQGGDEQAFEALFRAYYEELHGFVLRYVRSPEAAEDLLQNLFLDLWNRRRSWKPRRVKTYLYGAARNKSLDYLKHRRTRERWKAQARLEEGSREPRPEDDVHFADLAEAMQKAIDELPERCRVVYLLARQQGLTYAEIATLLDISINTVEVQIGRALKVLRERLAVYRSAPL